MIKRISLVLISATILGSGSCKKDKLTYSDTPEIEFVSISPSTVNSFSDPVTIRIAYKDGNGDLGENASGVENAFITDSRSNLTYGLRIRQLAPENETIKIKGEVDLILPGLGISGNSNETATFSIHIFDRAGNKSNIVTSSAITVLP
jgi:hypothetical protein